MLKYVFIVKYNYSSTGEYSYKTIIVHAKDENALVNEINSNDRLLNHLNTSNTTNTTNTTNSKLNNFEDLIIRYNELYRGLYEEYYKDIHSINSYNNLQALAETSTNNKIDKRMLAGNQIFESPNFKHSLIVF